MSKIHIILNDFSNVYMHNDVLVFFFVLALNKFMMMRDYNIRENYSNGKYVFCCC